MNYAADGTILAAPPTGWRRVVKGMGGRAAPWLMGGLGGLFGSRAAGRFGILMYHRVAAPTGGAPAPTRNVPPRQFRNQLRGLLARGYRAIALREMLQLSRNGLPVPRRDFAVTFDDGHENVYVHAWPVLRELGIPATVFVATAYLDGADPFPFDDWAFAARKRVPAESWRPLTTAQCREMFASGLVDLGSHTGTHENFRGRPEAFGRDVAGSVAALRSRFGLPDATFAFPFGIADADLAEAAQRAGVLCGLTTQSELVRPGADPFAWGRFDVDEKDTAATLAMKLDGWYSLARAVWLRWRGVRRSRVTS